MSNRDSMGGMWPSAVVLAAVIWAFCLPSEAKAQGGYQSSVRNSSTITCSSENGQRAYCDADTWGGVRLTRQFSNSPCDQNSSWGFDSRGIWVDRGCRAEFQVSAGNARAE